MPVGEIGARPRRMRDVCAACPIELWHLPALAPEAAVRMRRMSEALRPGGVLLIEEPDFVTIFGAAEPPALRHVMRAAMTVLESMSPVQVEYGRRACADLRAVGLIDVQAEGRTPIVAGGSPSQPTF